MSISSPLSHLAFHNNIRFNFTRKSELYFQHHVLKRAAPLLHMDIAKGADANLLVSTSRCLDVILSLIPTNEPGIPKEYVISIVEVGE